MASSRRPFCPPETWGVTLLGLPSGGAVAVSQVAAPCSAQGDPYKGRPVGLRGLLCGGESSGFRSALLLHGLPAEDSAVQGCGERAACILSLLALPKGPGQLGGLEPSHMLFQHKVTVAPRRPRFCFPIGLQETRHHGGGAESPSRPQRRVFAPQAATSCDALPAQNEDLFPLSSIKASDFPRPLQSEDKMVWNDLPESLPKRRRSLQN